MNFVREISVHDADGTLITFGIDEDGKVWIVTNMDGASEGIDTEYFGFSALPFTDLAHGLVSLGFAALRIGMAIPIESGTWHGTEIGPQGIVIHTDAVSAYPDDEAICNGANDGSCPKHSEINVRTIPVSASAEEYAKRTSELLGEKDNDK